MSEQTKIVYRHGGGGAIGGPLWAMGWLFTIGYLKLTFWKGVFAIIVWPYFLGLHFAK
jgi:hypothetical protein